MNRRNWLLVMLAAATAAALLAPRGLALGPAPYPTGEPVFPAYTPEAGVIQPGEKLTYRFSWNGFAAAQAVWETKLAPNRPGWLMSRAEGTIIGYPATLYRGNDYVTSCVRADTFKADTFSIRIRESLDSYDMTVTFNPAAGQASRTKIYRTRRTAKEFQFVNAYCPVGLALLIRSLPWKTGDLRKFEVIDGNDRYLMVIQGGPIETVKVPAGTFKAIRLIPSIFELPRRLNRANARYWEKQRRKDAGRTADMTSFTFWMAVDPPRPYLKVRTDVFFGHVDMELVSISVPAP